MYQDIVFIQGDEASKPLYILNDEGIQEVIAYLLQWDIEHNPYEIKDKPSAGPYDTVYRVGDLVLSYSYRLGYIGLERVIP